MNLLMQKLPRRALPKELALSGDVTLRFHPRVATKGSYTVLTGDDGRVKIKGWKNFIEELGWEVNSKIVMLFCRCDDKAWLFFNHLG
jgi:hypothetical protein